MDPLSVPLEIREANFKKGNIVPNASFEEATLGKNDSTITDFNLAGWNIVGTNVELVDIREPAYDKTEAATGNRAIKITRTEADVDDLTRASSGVISDFIPVIPANYELYYDIKLENVVPSTNVDRFQNRVNEDIDIRLIYYDENKKEMSPAVYFEFMGKDIDNSFKGFGFSNYYFVDHFDWAKVHGRTWEYPFSEGDMPEGCRYIKIFAGLKCGGTMWVDNIDMRISKWSFTPAERMAALFDSSYSLIDLLIPKPKTIDNRRTLSLEGKKLAIVDNPGATQERKAAASLLSKHISLAGKTAEVVAGAPSGAGQDALVIYLTKPGQTFGNDLGAEFARIAGQDQGYFIRQRDNRVILGANTDAGLFYAATTLSQLIDKEGGKLEIADITDSPDFAGRSSRMMNYQTDWYIQHAAALTPAEKDSIRSERDADLKQQIEDVDFYAFYKINKLYNEYHQLSERWWGKDEFFNKLYSSVGERCRQYGLAIRPAVMFNPYIHLGMEQPERLLPDSLKQIFSHVDDHSFTMVKNLLKPALEAGTRTVMFCADDYIPHYGIRGEYTLFNAKDKARFLNLADAQHFFINRLKSWLETDWNGVRLEFVPAPYNNRFIDYGRGTADAYYRDLAAHLDEDIPIIWTGNTVRSLHYDLADIRRAVNVYRRKPMLWDNTPYARTVETKNGGYTTNYPAKSVLCNLFEPYDVTYTGPFLDQVDSHFYNNDIGFGEISKIKYLTFADFSWNTADYDPEFSLYKAMVHSVGVQGARLLLEFNDAFYQFVTHWSKARTEKKHDVKYVPTAAEKSKGEERKEKMLSAFEALGPIDNPNLKKALKAEMQRKIKEWNEIAI